MSRPMAGREGNTTTPFEYRRPEARKLLYGVSISRPTAGREAKRAPLSRIGAQRRVNCDKGGRRFKASKADDVP